MNKIKVGVALCDMHDSLSLPKGAKNVQHIRVKCGSSSDVVLSILGRARTDRTYVNKWLVVVEVWYGTVKCVYSYDNDMLGMVQFDMENDSHA